MKIELKFEPRDLWVGVFWDRKGRSAWNPRRPAAPAASEVLHVYVCPLPMLVVHLEFAR